MVEVALHGYSHRKITLPRRGWLSPEFRGETYETQLEKLREGKEVLEQLTGQDVSTFIPPWNAYDQNTVRALEEAGFRNLCAGTGNGTHDGTSPLVFLPGSRITLKELRGEILSLRQSVSQPPETQNVIVVVFHDYELQDSQENGESEPGSAITLSELDGLLGWMKSQDYVRALTVAQAARELSGLDARRDSLCTSVYKALQFLPGASRSFFAHYPTVEALKSKRNKVWMELLAGYTALVAVGAALCYGVSALLVDRLRIRPLIMFTAALVLSGLAAGWSLRNLYLAGYRELLVLCGALSLCAGASVAALRRARRRPSGQ